MKPLHLVFLIALLLMAACGTAASPTDAPGNFHFDVSGAAGGTFTGRGSFSSFGEGGVQINLSSETGQTVTILLPAAAATGEHTPVSASLSLDASSSSVLDYGLGYSQLNTDGGIVDNFEQLESGTLTLTDLTAPTGTFEFTAILPETGDSVTVKGSFNHLPPQT
jgi:hypothetical protein